MSLAFPKASSSRIGKNTLLNFTGAGTNVAPAISVGVYQIRVLSQIAGFLAVGSSAGSSGDGTQISANVAGGDYFTVIPGSIPYFSSFAATTGTVSVTEMS